MLRSKFWEQKTSNDSYFEQYLEDFRNFDVEFKLVLRSKLREEKILNDSYFEQYPEDFQNCDVEFDFVLRSKFREQKILKDPYFEQHERFSNDEGRNNEYFMFKSASPPHKSEILAELELILVQS